MEFVHAGLQAMRHEIGEFGQMPQLPVSSQNPCPFLRALVAEGLLDDNFEPLPHLAKTICRVARTGIGNPSLPYWAIVLIGMIANGLGPVQIAKNLRKGAHLSGLRNGPLDKKGVGTRILDEKGNVDVSQIERMASFGSIKHCADGTSETGLDANEIVQFMDANLARTGGKHRKIDRQLMNGEWPVLLKAIGKDGTNGRYLSIEDVRCLAIHRRLPERMRTELGLSA
jgi:hypothetical protein